MMLIPWILALGLTQDPVPARAVPAPVERFEVASLVLEDATLAEACAALERSSGLPVRARGAAGRPVTLTLADSSFWEAVLALCVAAEVGLAPVGTGGDVVLLGQAWPQPNAAADGLVLVSARVSAVAGERRGTLDLELRVPPGLRVVGAIDPSLKSSQSADG